MNTKDRLWVRVLRWVARVTALVMVVFILLMFIGEGIADGFEGLLTLTLREGLLMAAFVVVFLGLLLGWRWEVLGGVLVIGGTAAFYWLDFAYSGTLPRGPYFLLIAFPGLLYLICGLGSGRKQSISKR